MSTKHLLVAMIVVTSVTTACTPQPTTPSLPLERAWEVVNLTQVPPELALAENLAARDCMNKKGHKITYDTTIRELPYDVIGGVTGIHFTREKATQYGYSKTRELTPDPIDTYISSLPENEKEKVRFDYIGDGERISLNDFWGSGSGFPKNGCFSEGLIAVYGSMEDAIRVRNLPNSIHNMGNIDNNNIDKIILRLLPVYEQCMKDAGYHVVGLNAEKLAVKKFGAYRKVGETPHQEEQKLAGTDYDCQKEANIQDELTQAWAEKAGTWILAHESEITGMQEIIKTSTARAKAIIKK
ncbi:MAG: hypothetical protein ACRDAX_10080 [Propionibacteriaceae bacterium]